MLAGTTAEIIVRENGVGIPPDSLDRILLAQVLLGGPDEDRRRAKEAGFDHHLVKPADLAELEALLSLHELD